MISWKPIVSGVDVAITPEHVLIITRVDHGGLVEHRLSVIERFPSHYYTEAYKAFKALRPPPFWDKTWGPKADLKLYCEEHFSKTWTVLMTRPDPKEELSSIRIRSIRRASVQGKVNQRVIAKNYGVSIAVVRDIVRDVAEDELSFVYQCSRCLVPVELPTLVDSPPKCPSNWCPSKRTEDVTKDWHSVGHLFPDRPRTAISRLISLILDLHP